MSIRLAWVTARAARGLDEDEPFAFAAFERAGTQVDLVDWDDPSVPWGDYDRVVLRSPWDYAQRLPEFLEWIDRVDAVTELVNSPAMVHWSLDKRYLGELAAAGIPITATEFFAPGANPTFPAGDFVIKPAVGAGSRDTASYGPDHLDEANAHVERLHAAGQVVLVQPFVASIATDGEWPMLFFRGEFSHSANKRIVLPRATVIDGLYVEESNSSHVAGPAQIAVAEAAIAFVSAKFGTPTYARVDIVRADSESGDDGGYLVLEVELIEPSLFLPYADASAADRLVAALTAE